MVAVVALVALLGLGNLDPRRRVLSSFSTGAYSLLSRRVIGNPSTSPSSSSVSSFFD